MLTPDERKIAAARAETWDAGADWMRGTPGLAEAVEVLRQDPARAVDG